jgi:release factor glutamine methyltransferase
MTAPLTIESVRARLSGSLLLLPDKPEETVDSTARALWLKAADLPVSAQRAMAMELPALTPQQATELDRMIERRLAGVPLAHLTSRQSFLGLEMLAGPEALVPRKETELLARSALALVAGQEARSLEIVDVCTGSGNVALALAHQIPQARVHAADLSDAAISLARKNCTHLGLDQRVTFHCGDLLGPFDSPEFLGRVHLLTCNPPYINSGKVERMPAEISGHEPRLAFDGGALGIGILMRLIKDAPRFLREGGWVAFEVGLGQGPALVKRMQASPAYRQVRSATDESGAIRVVMAQC